VAEYTTSRGGATEPEGANLTRRVFAGVRKPVVDSESLAAAHERIRPMQ
jgi:hypothetical protein